MPIPSGYVSGQVIQAVPTGIQSGLVPIVPTSVVVGSGSATTSAYGLVTFTGASSVSLNGIFSATYNNYRIILSPDAASTTLDIQARLRISGSDVTTASSYQQENMFASDNTVTGQVSTGQSIWEFINNYSGTYSVYAICVAELQRPFLTKKKTAITNSSFVTNAGAFRTRQSGYTQESTSACDGLSIICSTGNIGGTISVYGYTI